MVSKKKKKSRDNTTNESITDNTNTMLFSIRRLSKAPGCAIVSIKDGLFAHSTGKAMTGQNLVFQKPIKKFEVHQPNTEDKPSFWAILGSGRSEFVKIAAGKYLPIEPSMRWYPTLRRQLGYHHIQFLDFKESMGVEKAHLSARYESYSHLRALDPSDDTNSVINYITGSNNYNNSLSVDKNFVDELLDLFELKEIRDRWINSLSNGQMRRARLAKMLVFKPELAIIEDPFLGLDPQGSVLVSLSLKRMSEQLNTAIILSLRSVDTIPEWVTHIGYVKNKEGMIFSGTTSEYQNFANTHLKEDSVDLDYLKNSKYVAILHEQTLSTGERPHVEFHNASVVYKGKTLLKNFNWKLGRGSIWRVAGVNGSGKTTLLSFITADHPQSWRSVISIDNKIRATGKGVTFFDVNNSIGISSPEIHSLVPGNMTMLQVILNGLVKDVGNSNFIFKFKGEIPSYAQNLLEKFSDVLSIYSNIPFGDLSVTNQKLALFLRAIIKQPDICILDEAFSCMEDINLLRRCHSLVENELPSTTFLVIGHINWELPKCQYMLHLNGDESHTYIIGRIL